MSINFKIKLSKLHFMKIQRGLILLFLFVVQFVSGQNSRFSQIWTAPMQLNPSLTGRFDGKMRLSYMNSSQESNQNQFQMQHRNLSLDIKFGKYKSSGDEVIPSINDTSTLYGKPGKEAKDEIYKKQKFPGYWGAGFNYYQYGDDKSPLSAKFYALSLARHFYNKSNKYFGFGVQSTYAQGFLDENKGNAYLLEISGSGFRYPILTTSNNRVTSTNYLDFNGGAYYGMTTDAVMFELGASMHHLFYPKSDLFNKDSETKLRHRAAAYSLLRLRLNDKWGIVQRNVYWQEGLYYRSRNLKDSFQIVSFWTGLEFYKINPSQKLNFNFGFYTRSLRTLMPYFNINFSNFANLRYSYEQPINSTKYSAYSAKRSELALILSYQRKTAPGTRFYKKVNFW